MAEQEKKVPQEQEKKDKLDSNLKSYLMIALLVFVVFSILSSRRGSFC